MKKLVIIGILLLVVVGGLVYVKKMKDTSDIKSLENSTQNVIDTTNPNDFSVSETPTGGAPALNTTDDINKELQSIETDLDNTSANAANIPDVTP